MSDNQVLLNLISVGEDSFLELNELQFSEQGQVIAPHRNGMADEFAAMANSNNGVVILGENDKTREISGIPEHALDNAETWVRDLVNDLIKPPLVCRIKKVQLDLPAGDKRNVLKISIPRSLFVHRSPGGYLHRVGSSKRQMTPEYLARLFQQRSQARLIRFDEQVVADAEIDAQRTHFESSRQMPGSAG